jgi:hypothetical protein
MFCQRNEHQTNRACTDNEDAITGGQPGVFNALNNAGQRLSESSVAERGIRLEPEHVLLGDSGGDNNGLGIGAVQEEEVVAEILLLMLAKEAPAAWGRVRDYNAVSNFPFFTSHSALPTPHFRDHAGQFVTEHRGRDNHLRVIAAFKHFQVGAAGKGRFDLHTHFPGFQWRHGDVFDSDIFFAIEHGGFHW